MYRQTDPEFYDEALRGGIEQSVVYSLEATVFGCTDEEFAIVARRVDRVVSNVIRLAPIRMDDGNLVVVPEMSHLLWWVSGHLFNTSIPMLHAIHVMGVAAGNLGFGSLGSDLGPEEVQEYRGGRVSVRYHRHESHPIMYISVTDMSEKDFDILYSHVYRDSFTEHVTVKFTNDGHKVRFPTASKQRRRARAEERRRRIETEASSSGSGSSSASSS